MAPLRIAETLAVVVVIDGASCCSGSGAWYEDAATALGLMNGVGGGSDAWYQPLNKKRRMPLPPRILTMRGAPMVAAVAEATSAAATSET